MKKPAIRKRVPCLVCAVVLGALAASAPGQEKSHDALAESRAKAKAENQRVLLLVTGGDAAVDAALMKSLANYRELGKLLKYEYQTAALPAASLPGTDALKRLKLDLDKLALPALAALSTENEVLGILNARQMIADGSFSPDRVSSFLNKHVSEAVHARKVLADGLATAKESNRHAFVYLSAPW